VALEAFFAAMSESEVVITGMGIICPLGIGPAAVWDAISAGRSGVRPIQSYDASGCGVRFAGEVADFDPKAYVRPRKSLKVMSREIQFGFAAADMALQDAGFAPEVVAPERIGVVFGADPIYSDLSEMEAVYRRSIVEGKFVYDRWAPSAMSEIYPLWMLKYLPNMIACHVAIAHDARGPNNTIMLTEVSSHLAIAEARRVIEGGRADMMVAGAASCFKLHPTPQMFRSEALLSRRNEDPAGACRPFDADRDGMVNGEGAAAFILEGRQHADRRGAPILARILGDASRFEPCREGKPLEGTAVASAIVAALSAAGIQPNDLGYVSASGLSTIEHDRAEACAIQHSLHDTPVTALKSYFGNLGAAGGAVEMAVSMLAARKRVIPPILNYTRPDPECPVNVVRGGIQASDKATVLLLSQTIPGQAAAILLGVEN
jgi:3-oxoacyl-[acyl-carrier-protein] synthase II